MPPVPGKRIRMHLRCPAPPIGAFVCAGALFLTHGQPALAEAGSIAAPAPLRARMADIRQQFVSRSDTLSIRDLQVQAEPARQFREFEVAFRLDATCRNPFDPEDIDVQGRFVFPDGREVSVPAFYFIAFDPVAGVTQLQGGIPFKPAGERCWKLRFTPPVAGEFCFCVTARDGTGRTARSETRSFTTVAARGPGFVRVSESNQMYFEDTVDGSLFWGTGVNVPWTRTRDPGLQPGAYRVSLFDTTRGTQSAAEEMLCSDGSLVIPIAALEADLALKFARAERHPGS